MDRGARFYLLDCLLLDLGVTADDLVALVMARLLGVEKADLNVGSYGFE